MASNMMKIKIVKVNLKLTSKEDFYSSVDAFHQLYERPESAITY